jgi:lysophospholipase
MPFVQVPGNPEPEGAVEQWFEGRGGVKLRALLAPALGGGAPRGSVIVCNGRTEFIEKYFEVIRELQVRGFAVFTMDWRGQGLSTRELPNPLKGHFASLDDPVGDLFTALRLYAPQLPKPHIVLAHSMGGCIALKALQSNKLIMDGAVFCAPMWGIANLKGAAEDFAKFMSAIGAGAMFVPGVETNWKNEKFSKRNSLTNDPERYARATGLVKAEPRLALAGPTLAWVAAAVEAFETFQQPTALKHLRLPVMVVSAGKESIVENRSHEVVAGQLPNARRIVIDGAKHEIMMEKDELRAQFWAAFDSIADQVSPHASTRAAQV